MYMRYDEIYHNRALEDKKVSCTGKTEGKTVKRDYCAKFPQTVMSQEVLAFIAIYHFKCWMLQNSIQTIRCITKKHSFISVWKIFNVVRIGCQDSSYVDVLSNSVITLTTFFFFYVQKLLCIFIQRLTFYRITLYTHRSDNLLL